MEMTFITLRNGCNFCMPFLFNLKHFWSRACEARPISNEVDHYHHHYCHYPFWNFFRIMPFSLLWCNNYNVIAFLWHLLSRTGKIMFQRMRWKFSCMNIFLCENFWPRGCEARPVSNKFDHYLHFLHHSFWKFLPIY